MYRNLPPFMQANPDAGSGDDRNYEAEALEAGWVPKDKWTGDPSKWTDAKVFMERGEKVLPIVLKTNRELKQRIAASEQRVAQMTQDFEAYRTMMEKARQREKAELEAQLAQARLVRAKAVTDGDGAEFDRADKAVKELEAVKEENDKPAPKGGDTIHPDFAAWKEKNPWYDVATNEDYFLEGTEIARSLVMKAIRNKQQPPEGLPLFSAVEKEMKKRHPDLRGAAQEIIDRGGDVDNDSGPSHEKGGGGNTSARGKARTYENLPPEAQKACDRFIKTGVISDKQGKTLAEKRAAYCADYDWS